ncbi:MAG: GNAT family N-acetyltransferase [Phycisphaeraceae bacterium]|nr:GNAT family N-acetyltransferase [Phycisphaeraceae bacterium]
MLVLIDPRSAPEAFLHGRHLRRSLDAAIYLEGDAVFPLSLSHESACRVLEALAERYHAADVHSIVVLLTPEMAPRASEVAFWLLRRSTDRAYILRASDGPAQPEEWGLWAAERVRRDDEKIRLKTWKPDVPRIQTQHLLLTAPTPEQTEGYYHDIVGTTMFDTLCWNGPASVEELWEYDQMALRRFASGQAAPAHFAVIDRKTQKRIGGCSWRPSPMGPHRGDIGYTISPAWQGKGLGKQAVGALVDWVFSIRRPFRIEADVFVGNDRSRRLLTSLGFTLEGTCRCRESKAGRPVDEWLFALRREEWESRRSDAPASYPSA